MTLAEMIQALKLKIAQNENQAASLQDELTALGNEHTLLADTLSAIDGLPDDHKSVLDDLLVDKSPDDKKG